MRRWITCRLTWSHDDPYRAFEVWGYKVEAAGEGTGFTCLHDVSQTGLRVTTRRWAPDGPPVADRRITITTAPVYSPGARYEWIDYNLSTSADAARNDQRGRAGPDRHHGGWRRAPDQLHRSGRGSAGTGAVAGDDERQAARRAGDARSRCPSAFINPRAAADDGRAGGARRARIRRSTIIAGAAEIPKIEPGAVYDASREMRVRFTAGAGYFAPARLQLTITYDG